MGPKKKKKEVQKVDNINYENGDDEKKEVVVEKKKIIVPDYNQHNISTKVYKINKRPKDDDSDEWEEIPMEEEITVSNGKANKTKKITTTEGMDIKEDNDTESDSDSDDYFKKRKEQRKKAKAAKKKNGSK